MDGSRVSLYGTRDAAANWEDACAKVLQEHQFERGFACPCSVCSRVRGIMIVVHGDDIMSFEPEHQQEWLDKHFESKHTVMEASSKLAKLMVMLTRKIVWQDNGIAYILDNVLRERVVEALNLQHVETLVTPAVTESESVDGESMR